MGEQKVVFADLAAHLTKKGSAVDDKELASKTFVGLYFSAHWCPPCRGFTPQLIQYYNEWQKANPGKTLEIIFVSSDRDDSDFNGYYADMPWVALKYASREQKDELSKMFGIRGIPTLVILDGSTGKLVTMDGRSQVRPGSGDFNFK